MLITRRGTNLYLVKQVDHGELAGEIARAWGNKRFDPPSHPESCCLAAARHDEGWRSWDDRPAMNDNEARPLHFLEIGMEDHIPLYRSGVEAVTALDDYAGLLVGMHWNGLYRGRWGLQPSPAGLIQVDRTPIQKLQDAAVAEEESRWITLKERLWDGRCLRSVFETELWHNYDRLQAWDLLSLFVCVSVLVNVSPDSEPVLLSSMLKSLDQQGGARLIPNVPTGIGREAVDIVLRVIEPGVVSMDPYPFTDPRVSFSVGAAVIPDRAYSRTEIAHAMKRAQNVVIHCDMRSAESSRLNEASAARSH
jgi:hypothetical protein